MMSGKKTPRYLIQEYADNVETEKSIHPVRRRRPLSRSPEDSSVSQSTVSSTTREPSRSGSKRKRSDVEEEFTPRHLIQGLIDTQDTAKPSTRKKKRVAELLPPSSNKVKKSRRRSSLGVPTLDKIISQFTPRSMITGFLEQGVEETPEQRAAKGDKSSSRSSLGDIPNNEISFHPVEASFHESKLAKEAKKAKVSRSRAAIHIVQRRSEKLARRAGEEIDFSQEEESDSTDGQLADTELGRQRQRDRSRGKSGLISEPDVDDTSAKDTSSVDPSPRKSLPHRKVTPSKRESMVSLRNASHLTENKSSSESVHKTVDSSRKTTPGKSSSKSKQKSPRVKRSSSSVISSPSSTPEKSRSRSHRAKNVSEEEEAIHDVAKDVEDKMSPEPADESIKEHEKVPDFESRTEQTVDGSDLHPSPRKSRPREYEPASTNEESVRISRTISNSSLGEDSASLSLQKEVGSSLPGRGSRSRLEVTSRESPASATRPRSQSKSRSSLPQEEDIAADSMGVDDGDNDDHSSLEVLPDEAVDEPRSGRSSPRNSTGLAKNVYDFHDDSPSKKLIGKLAKTLQRSASRGKHIADVDEDREDMEEEERLDYRFKSEDENENYADEPEESIITPLDKERHTYYSPLRTPHLKEKTTAKPVSMVTSTPKPPSMGEKQQAEKSKGKQKASSKKKDISYMPTSVVKGLFTHFCPSKVSKDAIAEVEKLSAVFWEQAANDLESYALHAHRKTIEEADVELLMKRQKFITPKESLPALVEKYLPLELRQEIIPICRSGNKLELK